MGGEYVAEKMECLIDARNIIRPARFDGVTVTWSGFDCNVII